jgi:hypothetical protein
VAVSARLGDAQGEVIVSAAAPHESVHELRLLPDATLQVRVLDANGAPAAGIDVVVHGPLRHMDGGEGVTHRMALAISDADGLATFVHAQHWAHRLVQRGARQPFEVRATVPGLDVAAPLDARDLPRDPVELRLPPTGRIEVVSQDGDGAPLHEGVFMAMAPLERTTEPFGFLPAQPDVAVFPHVPLGVTWTAWLPGVSGQLEFAGPKVAGDAVRITLRATTQPRLAGRLVQSKQPIADATLTLTEGRETIGTGRSDANGKFLVAYTSFWTGLHHRIDVTARTAAGASLTGWFRGRPRRNGDTYDLGDVPLGPTTAPPVMLAGRFFAPRGVESLRIDVHQRLGDGTATVDPDVTLAPDGTFVVHGPDPGEALFLVLQSDEYEPMEPIRFRYGTTRREIGLRPLIEVHVPFPVASRELAQCLRFEIEEIGERGSEGPDRMVWSDGVMTCTWRTSETGDHQVLVRRRGDEAPLVAAALDIDPDADGQCHVPPVAVPAVRVLRIEVPAAVGADLLQPAVTELVGAERRANAARDGDGTWLVASDQPVDLSVFVPGHRAVTLRGVDQNTNVALELGIPINFDLDLPTLAAGETVTLTLVGVEHDYDWNLDARIRGTRGTARLPTTGTYSLFADSWPNQSILVCEPNEIVVGDDGGTFRVVVRPEGK